MDGVIEDVVHSIHNANRIGYEALIERIFPETVDVNTVDIVMISADKKFSSSEESEFVWTCPDPELRPTSAVKADTNRMDQDSVVRSVSAV